MGKPGGQICINGVPGCSTDAAQPNRGSSTRASPSRRLGDEASFGFFLDSLEDSYGPPYL